MNYGKLAYNSLKDMTAMLAAMEKKTGINFASIMLDMDYDGNISGYQSGSLRITLPADAEINLSFMFELAPAAAGNMEIAFYVDRREFSRQSVYVRPDADSYSIQIITPKLTKGSHSLHAVVTGFGGGGTLKNDKFLAYGVGLAIDFAAYRLRVDSLGEQTFTALSDLGGVVIKLPLGREFRVREIRSFDIAKSSFGLVAAAVDGQGVLRVFSAWDNSESVRALRLHENVSACAVCAQDSQFDGYILFVAGGKVFISYFIFDGEELLTYGKRQAEGVFSTVTDVTAVKNRSSAPAFMAKTSAGVWELYQMGEDIKTAERHIMRIGMEITEI